MKRFWRKSGTFTTSLATLSTQFRNLTFSTSSKLLESTTTTTTSSTKRSNSTSKTTLLRTSAGLGRVHFRQGLPSQRWQLGHSGSQWEKFGGLHVGVVNMDQWLSLLMILAWVVIWVSFVFDLYLWSGSVFVFGLCFFFFSFLFFCLCCCDLGLSFWLLDLCSWLLGLIWEEHKEQVVMFLWKIIMISNNVLLLGFDSMVVIRWWSFGKKRRRLE